MFPDGNVTVKCENDGGNVGDEQTEEMVKRLRSGFPDEMENDPGPVIEGVTRFLQEQKRREKDQQKEAVREAEQEQGKRVGFGKKEQPEETRAQSTDEREETSGLGRGSAGLV